MKRIIYIGMDVHSTSFTLCAMEVRVGDEDRVITNIKVDADYRNVLKFIEGLKEKVGKRTTFICGYEAGCLGYTLQRQLSAAKVECKILAPTTMKVERGGKRIKTDKRDAKDIAQNLAYKTCSFVHIPTEEEQDIRDYLRLRDDHVRELKRIKQETNAYVLSHGHKYEGKSKWTIAHIKWLKGLPLSDVQKEILNEYLTTYEQLTDKITSFDERIEKFATDEKYHESVKKLSCLLGIKTYGAMTALVETGAFDRFATGDKYAAYLGLVPGEHSSDENVNRLSITKAGNRHMRRVLTEAAQAICKGQPGHKSIALRKRQEGNSHEIIAYADRANERLRRKYYRMIFNGKKRNVAITAVARELACFIWGMMTDNLERTA